MISLRGPFQKTFWDTLSKVVPDIFIEAGSTRRSQTLAQTEHMKIAAFLLLPVCPKLKKETFLKARLSFLEVIIPAALLYLEMSEAGFPWDFPTIMELVTEVSSP